MLIKCENEFVCYAFRVKPLNDFDKIWDWDSWRPEV